MGTRIRIKGEFWIGLFFVFTTAVIAAAFFALPFASYGAVRTGVIVFFVAFVVFMRLLLTRPLREFKAVWRATRWESER